MALVQVDWNPGPKILRTFAGSLVATGVLVAGVVGAWGARTLVGYGLGGLFVAAGLLALIGPAALKRPIYLAFTGPAWVLGNVVSRVLVAAVFYLLVTPMGLVAGRFGYDPLGLRAKKASYWSPVPADPSRPDNHERPF